MLVEGEAVLILAQEARAQMVEATAPFRVSSASLELVAVAAEVAAALESVAEPVGLES